MSGESWARPARVRVEARAKLNLGLAVGPRRDDGFHEIATVMQSISLADTLTAEPRRRGFTLAVRLEEAAARGRTLRAGAAAVPKGQRNLVISAARRAARRFGIEGGARFLLVKRIPSRAGLGGGSADAAAVIAGLLALHRVRPGASARLELAAELGSDVPFALAGGTALGLGRGEKLTRLGLGCTFRAVIAVPPWRVSTAWAYGRIDLQKYVLTPWRAKLRSAQVLGREGVSLKKAMRLGNTFEQVLGNRRTDFLSLCARLREAGASEVRMTGSGSAVFGILEPGVQATEVVRRFEGSEPLYVVRSVQAGLRLTSLL